MIKLYTTPVRFLLLVTLLFLPAGCAPYRDLPAGTVMQVNSSAVIERQEVSVPTIPVGPPPPTEYTIGPNDVLYVNVSGHPELLVAPGGTNTKVNGSRVDGTGTINLPLVGKVKVGGLTVPQAQTRIARALAKYLNNPWVVVEIAEYRSHPLYLLGSFRQPGTIFMDRPLTLLQGIAMGGGFDTNANLRGARLTRQGKIVPVDVYDLLTKGEPGANVWLKSEDTIYMPDGRATPVFIFGAVKKPGPVPVPLGGINLAQAIASAELRDTGYNINHVRIIRSLSTTRGELLVIDFERVLRGEALPIPLMEGDIVYVPKSAFGTWNDIIADILPTLQAVSSALQPFVSIEYLKRNY